MGVCVRRGGRAVGGPAGVADAADAVDVLAVVGELIKIFKKAAALEGAYAPVVLHGDPGGVIAAVFKPFESLQKYGRGLLRACEANYSAHYFSLLSCSSFAAEMKPRKSGCALLGRDLNSGWNCTPT